MSKRILVCFAALAGLTLGGLAVGNTAQATTLHQGETFQLGAQNGPKLVGEGRVLVERAPL